jgi:transposase-like protein
MPSVPFARSRNDRPVPARQRRLSESQRQAVVVAYEAGASMAELAQSHAVHRHTISLLLRKAGVAIRQTTEMSRDEIDQAIQLYESGLSLQKIGDQVGWNHNTIYRHLKTRGVVFRARVTGSTPDVAPNVTDGKRDFVRRC